MGNTTASWVQRRRARRLRDARRERAERRELELELANVPRTEIDELTTLVDLARQHDHDEADDLDDLLDAYAATSIAICRRPWQARIGALHERRAEIAELIRLFAARALLPEVDHAFDEAAIARRLALLDG